MLVEKGTFMIRVCERKQQKSRDISPGFLAVISVRERIRTYNATQNTSKIKGFGLSPLFIEQLL